MATRMQQRRGTAQQWIDAAPVVLAPGEIGFETDSNQFKIGDGTTEWQALSYFKNLESLGGSLDDYVPLTEKGIAGGVATLDIDGLIPLAQLPDGAAIDAEVTAAVSAATGALETSIQTLDEKVDDNHGTAMATIESSVSIAIASEVTRANGAYDAYGAASTAQTAAELYAVGQKEAAVTEANGYTDTEISAAITTEQGDRNTAIATAVADEATARNVAIGDAVDAEVILRDAAISTQSGLDRAYTDNAVSTLDASVSGALDTHTLDELNVHGIANTQELETQTGAQAKADLAQGAAENYADSLVGDVTVDGTLGNTVAARIASAEAYTDSQIDSHVAVTTNVHGIADTSKIVLKDALSTTLDGTLVVQGDLTVNGTNFSASATSITIEDNLVQLAHQNAANTVDLGLVVAYNDGTGKHAGIVRDVSDSKWKLFKDVASEPSTTVDFTQGSLDDLALNNVTVAGVVFTDGTQTKEGVPSRTPIVAKTASYTLSSLAERDSLIEVSSGSATTVTIPAESSVNYPIGTSIDILQTSSGQVTIAGAGGVTVNATPGLKLRTQWSSATLLKRAADTWVVYGDLTA